MSAPPLSLLVCTRNRAAQLAPFLAGLPAADLARTGAELVLVDNGSTDATAGMLASFAAAAAFPVTLLREERAGLSRARNAGLAACRAPLVAFTDDDCYLGEGYLDTALREFATGAWRFAGGRILLKDPRDARVAVNYSRRPRRFPPCSFLRAGVIQGANMLVAREVFDRVGAFDPDMGAGATFRCEDLEMLARASLGGFPGAYLPDLVVYHHHGRKPGPGTDALNRANAHGRGAYYAKFILEGHWSYLWGWMRRSAAPWRLGRIPAEVRGALDYARWRREHLAR